MQKFIELSRVRMQVPVHNTTKILETLQSSVMLYKKDQQFLENREYECNVPTGFSFFFHANYFEINFKTGIYFFFNAMKCKQEKTFQKKWKFFDRL